MLRCTISGAGGALDLNRESAMTTTSAENRKPKPVEIRRLWPSDLAIFRDHLLRLDDYSRHMRFGGGVSDAFLRQYAEHCFGKGDLVFGAFVDGGGVQDLVGPAGAVAALDALQGPRLPVAGGRRLGVEVARLRVRQAKPGVEYSAGIERGRGVVDHRQRRDRGQVGWIGGGRSGISEGFSVIPSCVGWPRPRPWRSGMLLHCSR